MVVRVVERRTGSAATHRLPADLFQASEYRSFLRVHGELSALAGTPPFTVQLGEAREEALSFEGLRASVMAVAARGVKAQRFKGLGEMNPSQLYDTTMDASKRTLQQVTVEDAAAADLTFAMLMGEKVEPRREFIEANARSVVNLDV